MVYLSTTAGVIRRINFPELGFAGIRIGFGVGAATGVIWWIDGFERFIIWVHFVISFQFWELNQLDQLC